MEMNFLKTKTTLIASFFAIITLIALSGLIINQPSQSEGCQGNTCIAPWGPVRMNQRPIYPMRGCGPNSCREFVRSAIIYPPANPQMPQQVVGSPPIGCGFTPGCGPAEMAPYWGSH
jgi:hypothetical protein